MNTKPKIIRERPGKATRASAEKALIDAAHSNRFASGGKASTRRWRSAMFLNQTGSLGGGAVVG